MAFLAILSSLMLLTVSNQAHAQNSSFLKTYKTSEGDMDGKVIVSASNGVLVGGYAAVMNPTNNVASNQAYLAYFDENGQPFWINNIFPVNESGNERNSSSIVAIVQDNFDPNVYYIGGNALLQESEPINGDGLTPIVDSTSLFFRKHLMPKYFGEMTDYDFLDNFNFRTYPFIAKVTITTNNLTIDWFREVEPNTLNSSGNTPILTSLAINKQNNLNPNLPINNLVVASITNEYKTLNGSMDFGKLSSELLFVNNIQTSSPSFLYYNHSTNFFSFVNSIKLVDNVLWGVGGHNTFATQEYKPMLFGLEGIDNLITASPANSTASFNIKQLDVGSNYFNSFFEDFSVLATPQTNGDVSYTFDLVGLLNNTNLNSKDGLSATCSATLNANGLAINSINITQVHSQQLNNINVGLHINRIKEASNPAQGFFILGSNPFGATNSLSPYFSYLIQQGGNTTHHPYRFTNNFYNDLYAYDFVEKSQNTNFTVGRLSRAGNGQPKHLALFKFLNYTASSPAYLPNEYCFAYGDLDNYLLSFQNSDYVEDFRNIGIQPSSNHSKIVNTLEIVNTCASTCARDTVADPTALWFYYPTMEQIMAVVANPINANRTNIYIEGNLIIDIDPQTVVPGFRFEDYTFFVGDNGTILQNLSGQQTIHFNQTTFTDCTNFMWRGFMISQNTTNQPIFDFSNCNFSNAFTALHSDNGAVFNVNDCSFEGNNTAMRVTRSLQTGLQNLVFTGNNTIIGNSTTGGVTANNPLKKPFDVLAGNSTAFIRANFGILLEDVAHFVVSGGLNISNTQVGIEGRNVAKFDVLNVNMQDIYRSFSITHPNFSPNANLHHLQTAAIWLKGRQAFYYQAPSDNLQAPLPTIVGFVRPLYQQLTFVSGNNLQRVVRGVEIQNAHNALVQYNVINEFNTGIWVETCTGPNNRVQYNTLNNINRPLNPQASTTGIWVGRPVQGNQNQNEQFTVVQNQVYDMNQVGIMASFLNNPIIEDNVVHIKISRRFQNNATANPYQAGISLVGTNLAFVRNNNIRMQQNQTYTANQLYANGQALETRGIEAVSAAINSTISDNIIEVVGTSMLLAGPQTNNKFTCNTMGKFVNGMLVANNATNVPDIGALAQPADNKWLNPFDNNALRAVNDGSGPLNFFFRGPSLVSNINAPTPNISLFGNIFLFPNQSGDFACGFQGPVGPPVGPSPPDEDAPFFPLASGINQFGSHTTIGNLYHEAEAIAARTLFKAIKDSLAANYAVPTIYVNFYNHNLNGPYGHYVAMCQAALLADSAVFAAARGAFVPNSLQEALVTQVLDLVAAFGFNQAQLQNDTNAYAILYDIAQMNPAIVGPAPHYAANFLSILVQGVLVPEFRKPWFGAETSSSDTPTNGILVYPNPVQGNEITIESKVAIAQITLWDMQGRIIFRVLDQNNSLTKHLSLPTLANGVYLLEVQSKTNDTFKQKVIVP